MIEGIHSLIVEAGIDQALWWRNSPYGNRWRHLSYTMCYFRWTDCPSFVLAATVDYPNCHHPVLFRPPPFWRITTISQALILQIALILQHRHIIASWFGEEGTILKLYSHHTSTKIFLHPMKCSLTQRILLQTLTKLCSTTYTGFLGAISVTILDLARHSILTI